MRRRTTTQQNAACAGGAGCGSAMPVEPIDRPSGDTGGRSRPATPFATPSARLIVLVALTLVAVACTSSPEAETESLSVVTETSPTVTATGGTAPTTPAGLGRDVAAVEAVVAAGGTTTVRASGLGDGVSWTASGGTFEGDGAEVIFTAPQLVGDYRIIATGSEGSAETIVSVPEMVVYASDFSAPPGAEWNTDAHTVSPSGEAFLGEFADERAQLVIGGLPTHDAVTIAFDLYILKSWDGLADNDWWSLEIDDERVLATTFSNDEKRQAWPEELPYADNPGQSGAFATDSLGYVFRTEDNPADSSYRIERTFFHEGSFMWIDFGGHNLTGVDDESWGIDNLTVSISKTPPGVLRPEANLDIDIDGTTMTVTGAVPDPSVVSTIEGAATEWFGGWTLDLEPQLAPDAIPPVWGPHLRDVLNQLRDATDVRLRLGLKTAVLEGTVVTQRYREELVAGVGDRLGRTVWLEDRLEFAVDQAIVDRVNGLVVQFESGSAELDPDDVVILDEVADILTSHPRMTVWVGGYTDLTGAPDENEALSDERAQNAYDHLIGRGISQDRLAWSGQGADDPVADGDDADAHAANRRAIFYVLDG